MSAPYLAEELRRAVYFEHTAKAHTVRFGRGITDGTAPSNLPTTAQPQHEYSIWWGGAAERASNENSDGQDTAVSAFPAMRLDGGVLRRVSRATT